MQKNKNASMSFIGKNRFLIAILLFSLSIRIFQYSSNAPVWDSAVYVNMGKYMLSLGKIGLWEDSRPLILPFILGLFWKTGANPLLAGKVLMTVFSLGCIWLTYLIGRKAFSAKVAIIASLLLSLMPTFLFYDTQVLTGIPSLFFALLGIYIFLNEKYITAGIVLCISFMTRFLQLGVFGILSAILLYLWLASGFGKKQLISLLRFEAGFFVLFLPYLIFNYVLYSNPLFPFLRQVFMASFTGWPWWEPFSFYFVRLFRENFLLPLVILGIYLAIRDSWQLWIPGKGNKAQSKRIAMAQAIPLLLFLLYFSYFTAIRHKEMRFAITFMPYMCLLAAYALYWAAYGLYAMVSKGISKSRKPKTFISQGSKDSAIPFAIIVIVVLAWAAIAFATGGIFLPQDKSEVSVFQKYVAGLNESRGLWISSPNQILLSDAKAGVLIYYPTFDSSTIPVLESRLGKARSVLLDTCNVPCPPWDAACPSMKKGLISFLKSDFSIVYMNESSSCATYIFTRN